MSQTTTEAAPAPGDILLHLIVALLAPMFLTVSNGNIDHARLAAMETVNAYRARNHADLIAIVQIIAFGLAAIGSLSLSMADNISLTMTLRLRGNANALNRSAEQNRRALRESSPKQEALPEPAALPEPEALPEPAALMDVAAARQLAAESAARLVEQPQLTPTPPVTEKRHQEIWAIAMVKEASDISAGLIHLPPAERKAASIRAAALSSTANQLLTGGSSPPLKTPVAATGPR